MRDMTWNWAKMVAFFALAAVVAGCGCSPKMAARDVSVIVDDSLRDSTGKLRSVQVDVIAVNAGELERWKMESLQNYWTPGRSSLPGTKDKCVMKFDATENVNTHKLSRQDPLWATWDAKQAMDLVVVADIPTYQGPGAGMADSRRQILPLDQCRWDSTENPIQISVTSAGLVIQTQPKPEKKP